jgi:hypothetical protein
MCRIKWSGSLIILPVLVIFHISVNAQSRFVPALWTKPDGTQSNILIAFGQWNITPRQIKYKNSEDAQERALTPVQVQSLHVYAQKEERYLGKEVNLAIFSKDPSENSTFFQEKKSVFLRTLVEGKLSLHSYVDENRIAHFFIQTDTSWEELIFHSFYTDQSQQTTRQHTKYQTSLLRATLDCPALANRIRQLPSGERSFIQIVTAYNTAPCPGALTFKEAQTKGKLMVGFRVGASYTYNQTSFDYSRPYSGQYSFFQPKVGLGIHYTLPRRNGKRAMLLELFYDQQAYETNVPVPSRITQNYVQSCLSFRRYFGAKTIKSFINAGLLFGVPTGKAQRTYGWPLDYSPASQSGISIGAGVRRTRWELEARLNGHHFLGLDKKGVKHSVAGMLSFAVWL